MVRDPDGNLWNTRACEAECTVATYNEKLSFTEPQEFIMAACVGAANSSEWRISVQERMRLQIREVGQSLQLPVTIEVKVLPVQNGTGIDLTVSNVGFGAMQTQKVKAQAATFVKRLYYELDRPNREAAEEEAERERQAEKEKKRQAQLRAEEAEEAQRLAARAHAMQQLAKLKSPLAGEPKSNGEGEAAPIDPANLPEIRLDDILPPRRSRDASVTSRYSPNPTHPGHELSHPAPVPAPPATQADFVASLERLANLHKMGALTDEEFRIAKNKLLQL